MVIGIDISQLAFPGTGVANYLENLLSTLLNIDKKNEYVLFYSSLRKNFDPSKYSFLDNPNVSLKLFKLPPTLLDYMWNGLHIFPIENLVGKVDLFITSDWTEPPVKKAKKATIIYDTIVYKFPKESDKKIIDTQKRKLKWVKKETDIVFTISASSKKDIEEILKIDNKKIHVIYPGLSI
jgi:glycosyltransferase involved in cell wall biosynthesis